MQSLVITPSSPWPPTMGGRQRAALLVRALARLGPVATIVTSSDPITDEPDVAPVLAKEFGLLEVVPPGRPSLRLPWRLARGWLVRKRVLDAWATRWDGAAGALRSDPYTAERVAQHVRHLEPDLVAFYGTPALVASGVLDLRDRPRVWLDVDDVPTVMVDEASGPRRAWRRASLLRRQRATLDAADVLTVTKGEDLASAPGLRRATVLPNLPWSLAEGRLPTVAPPPGRARLLSVASMSWPPHAEGVAWFLDDVWPRVRASRPDATLDLVGSPPDASRAAAWSAVPGVRFVGRVDDVAACYAECDLAIVPAHRGGGSSIKTPEAYLHGRACVVTSAGARGWRQLLPADDVMAVADDAAGFAAAVSRLLGDPERARRMAAAGREAVISGLSFERFAATAAEVAARALART